MRAAGIRGFALALVLAGGCSKTRSLYIERPWSKDRVVVLAITDAQGRPLETAPHLVGAGDIERLAAETSEPFRIFARAYPPASSGGPDLDRCGVRFGGPNAALPPGDAFASGVLDAGASGAIRLDPDDRKIDLDLRYAMSCPVGPTSLCDRIRVSTYPMPNMCNMVSVAAASSDVVFAAFDCGILLRILPGGAATPVQVGAAVAMIRSDHRGTEFGVLAGGRLFELGDDGRSIRVFDAPFSAARVAIGRDGKAYAYTSDHVALLTEGSTAAVAVPGFPASLEDLAVVSSTRAAAVASGSIYVLDQGAWVKELQVSSDTHIAADVDIFALYTPNTIAVRDTATKKWIPLRAPFQMMNRSMVSIGGGRLIAGGYGGSLAAWDGSDWCSIETGYLLSVNDLDATPDRKTVFGVSDSSDATQDVVLVRFDLP